MTDLSIVIVNYNAKGFLEACLQSIYETVESIKFEVLVVDNNSSEKIEGLMKGKFPDVKLFLNNSNEGFAKANNKAINKCSGRYLLLLNNDTILLPGAVDTLYSIMEKSPEVAILGPQILTEGKTIQESFYKTPNLFSEFMRKSFYNKIIKSKKSLIGKRLYIKYQKEQEVDWVTGACMMIRKKAILEAGFFDENYFMYFEDADLCCRVRGKGWKVKYTPLARIIHFGGMSKRSNETAVAKEYRASQLNFYRKHHNKFTFIVLKTYLLLKYMHKAISFMLLFLIKKNSLAELKENLTDSGDIFCFILKYSYE
ncbi:MAG: hypothetical protein CMD96_08980 [Gammaproteobacteria bacterium]|jgi:hypothetical protein|nr:hypothetical protein [Gammaproteobacteria bacterium]HJP17075.1 glycosyltransferase family 2 protein [Nitrospinota bacterium]|tara:strand:+ start:2634 stop:3569 length:936 start_codon:yes stop_codon:yes gene_type:complete